MYRVTSVGGRRVEEYVKAARRGEALAYELERPAVAVHHIFIYSYT